MSEKSQQLDTKNLVAAESRGKKRLNFVDEVNSTSRNEEVAGDADEIAPGFGML
jgi:hypothetical protein